MPKNFYQITAPPTKNIQITGVRVTLQYLLHLQSEPVHPTAHVRNTARQPHLCVRCNRDHDCSARSTRCKATTFTS